MTRGLFVTFDGLSPTIADSQVVVHVSEMRKMGIEIELWVFATKRSVYEHSLRRLPALRSAHGDWIKLFGAVRPTVPMSELANAMVLAWLIARRAPDVAFVHARTDYAAVVCGLVRLIRKFVLVWDCRGDTEAEFLSKYSQTTLLRRAAAPAQAAILRLRTRLAARLCDKAIFVSERLRAKRAPGGFFKPTEIIPCVASSELFYFSSDLRIMYRNKLAVDIDQKLVIYSGSLAGYQIFNKSVALFKQLADQDASIKLLVLTPYLDEAAEYLKSVPTGRYQLMSAPLQEVNGYLNAADFGLFLREPGEVNEVASPVKFAEYCLAGLPVIMTNAVEQSYALSRRLGNGIIYNFKALSDKLDPFSDARRGAIAREATQFLSRKAVSGKYQCLYLGSGVRLDASRPEA